MTHTVGKAGLAYYFPWHVSCLSAGILHHPKRKAFKYAPDVQLKQDLGLSIQLGS